MSVLFILVKGHIDFLYHLLRPRPMLLLNLSILPCYDQLYHRYTIEFNPNPLLITHAVPSECLLLHQMDTVVKRLGLEQRGRQTSGATCRL